ncbi:GAF domain-containing sensor histidine kinase [Nocardiopsis changdeensis]|uniref:GAF domain-containing sensor histidine kinase n=1 Tax=Nocardiopsis changdeensis TaxID=2831969 RepID=A0ABX8BH53_9ACTN|nr:MULTISPECIES: GAF domain-containing sensor histidine kinase [Nocardiopsis]QUX20173.1 GAF domain-containing sensor histidine kinase [Nocardiopsis changdeensis]QYX36101.1 GAF domain-containing sensor histidine kinase [Nocardiopsis sp. MT53]
MSDGEGTAPGQERLSLPEVRLDDLLDEVRSRLSEISMTQERIRTLLEAVVSIGEGLELDPLLLRITETASSLVDARYGALGVIGPDGEMSRFIPVGLRPDEISSIEHWPRGEGILGLLIKEPEPLRLGDVSDHPESVGFPRGHPVMRTFLGVPIRIRDRVFGNLYMTDKRDGGQFTGDDELLLRALATAAGTAIENAQLFAETQSRETWLDASGQITTRLLSGAPPEEVLRLVARRARLMAHADLSVIAMPGEEPATLTVRVWDAPEGDGSPEGAVHGRRGASLAAGVRGATLACTPGTLLGRVYLSGDPIRTDISEHCDPGIEFLAELGLGAILVLPFGPPGGARGVLLLARAAGREEFPTAWMGMLAAFADQAAVALELAEARLDSERLSVLEDRDRIARDLHDTVIQRLYATAITLMGTVRRIDDATSSQRVQNAVTDLDDTIRQIRSTIFALQSSGEDSSRLRSRVLDLVNGATDPLGFAPRLLTQGPVDTAVDEATGGHLVAVLRELLSNAARHAHATAVDVEVSVADGRVVLRVSDDGAGIPEDAHRSGLRNIVSRAEELGGSVEIDSAPGGGTTVRWAVPARARA